MYVNSSSREVSVKYYDIESDTIGRPMVTVHQGEKYYRFESVLEGASDPFGINYTDNYAVVVSNPTTDIVHWNIQDRRAMLPLST